MQQEGWQVTEKGYAIAQYILDRFHNTLDPLDEIAADAGLTTEEAQMLMIMVENGGLMIIDEEEDIT